MKNLKMIIYWTSTLVVAGELVIGGVGGLLHLSTCGMLAANDAAPTLKAEQMRLHPK